MWLQDCILPTFLLYIPLDWVEYISVRKCSLWKSITAVQPVPSLAAVSTGDDHKERETGELRSSCSCSGQSLTEREMDPDWGRWFILDSEHPLSTGQSFLRWVSHCSCLPRIHHYYIIGQIVIITGRQCCSFRAKAFWVSGEGRWWQERKADWKNYFQHIYPLAVVQDTPSGPWSQTLRLNMCFYSPPSFLYNPSFHSVIYSSSPSSSSSSSALVFCCILHWHSQKQQSLEGKYAKLLYELPFCSGRGHCTKTCQLFCFLSNKY